jgi:hypothetical protein
MTLGSFLKYNEIGKQYLIRLLESRMLKEKSSDFIEAIANQLTTGYADHSFCINIDEAIKLGLKVTELKGEELDIIWEIYMLNKEKEEILMSIKKVDVNEFLKNLPPDLITKLPEPIQTKIKPKKPK